MIETLNSVQQQADLYLICKSNCTDQCYREYLEKTLTTGFGQLHEVEYEKIDFSKPSIVVLWPILETDESQIVKLTRKLISFLEHSNQYRKRYAIVHADDNSYIIGGYIFDPINKLCKTPENDYKYDPKTETFHPIVLLPNTIVSFGLSIGERDSIQEKVLKNLIVDFFFDGKFIVVIGRHTPSNQPLSQCYAMEMKNQPEKWICLPDLPVSTSGPGVGMIDGEIHIIGGFDIISTESITHGEYYCLTWPIDTKWKQRKSIEPIRARSLVLIVPNSSTPYERDVYVAGGYDVNVKHHPFVVSDIYVYNDQENNWKFITIITDLKLTDGLSFYDDKLHVSESIVTMNNEYDQQIIRSFDFKTHQWIELDHTYRRRQQ